MCLVTVVVMNSISSSKSAFRSPLFCPHNIKIFHMDNIGSEQNSWKSCWIGVFTALRYRPPPRGRFGRRSRRNSYDFALSVREGEDDFAPFFGDFRNLLSVLLAPVSRFFACLQQTLTVALMIANGDTPTTTRCLQKHDIITLIGNYP